MSDTTHDAAVTTLTAEVRTLVIGNRQVTLSVLGQLDIVNPYAVAPIGRVRPRGTENQIHVIGPRKAGPERGTLARSWLPTRARVMDPNMPPEDACWCPENRTCSCGLCQGCGAIWSKDHTCLCPRPCDCETCTGTCWCTTTCRCPELVELYRPWVDDRGRLESVYDRWSALPLLVLAGLR